MSPSVFWNAARHALHHLGGRIVGEEIHRELARDEARGRGMTGKNVERALDLEKLAEPGKL